MPGETSRDRRKGQGRNLDASCTAIAGSRYGRWRAVAFLAPVRRIGTACNPTFFGHFREPLVGKTVHWHPDIFVAPAQVQVTNRTTRVTLGWQAAAALRPGPVGATCILFSSSPIQSPSRSCASYFSNLVRSSDEPEIRCSISFSSTLHFSRRIFIYISRYIFAMM